MSEIETITSRDNAKLKFARRVRDGKERDFMFIEGFRLCEEAFRSGIEIIETYIADPISAGSKVLSLIGKRSEMMKVAAKIYDSIADTENSQGLIMIARRPKAKFADIDALFTKENLTLVVFLDRVNNPSNLGAVVRTAEAAGVSALIVSKESADPYSPKAIRASMGSCFRLPIFENVLIHEVLKMAVRKGMITTAADVDAKESYTEINWTKPRILFFGSEAHGLSEDFLNKIEQPLTIPMLNGVESLNLAVSAGIILFEAKRRRNSND